jgi:hypothetical protein
MPLLLPLKKQLERGTRDYRDFRDAEIDELLRACGFETSQRRAQFLLPMLAHRRANGWAPLHAIERAARLSGLTRVFGSPVVVRAERRRS